MAGLTYSAYRTELQTLVASQDPDASFDAILPGCIDYAEQRLYRELNLINTVEVLTASLTSGSRNFSIDTSFVAINNINVITPFGGTVDNGSRNPLVPTTRDLLDTLYPGVSVMGVPQMFSMVTQWTGILAPTPDSAYLVEVAGTYRPAALSASNTTTFLSTNLPDIFVAASMVFLSGYMRNFGAQQSDPQMSSSWEAQYQALKSSANAEEARKHFWASSWSSQPVSQDAQPQRG